MIEPISLPHRHLRVTSAQRRSSATVVFVATWDDVRRLALSLPETSEALSRGTPTWRVKDKFFVWERPLRRADYEALGDAAPDGPILGARVPDIGVKDALLADDPGVYFTTPHFDGYPAILVRLPGIDVGMLETIVGNAWRLRAPKALLAKAEAGAERD